MRTGAILPCHQVSCHVRVDVARGFTAFSVGGTRRLDVVAVQTAFVGT